MTDSRTQPDGPGPDQADSPPAATTPWYRRISRGRKMVLPLMTVAFLVVVLVSFHTILLPFILACVIVYLMEPVVRRLAVRLPRWAAVILVYLGFFGVLTLAMIFVVPRFVSEIVRFAETVPETVAEFRAENLPGINDRVQGFARDYLPVVSAPTRHQRAHALVRDAWQDAAGVAGATSVAKARVRQAADVDVRVQLEGQDGRLKRHVQTVVGPRRSTTPADFHATHGQWMPVGATRQPLVRVVPSQQGGLDVYMSQGSIDISRVDEGQWRLRRPSKAQPRLGADGVEVKSVLDLEARLNEIIEGAISTSHDRIAAVISYAQTLVVGIIQALVAIILTFMVAAFISIDLPSIRRFCRDLVPRDFRQDFDDLRERVDRGLSGVVRGQLTICLVNAVLTYVGLVVLGVKFALLLGVVAGVLSLIPIFGTIMSTIPIVIIGLMSGFGTGLLALCWVLIIHFVEANILNPQIIGNSAHIHPVIVIFALLAGESAFGLVGALLAVPVASILLELFKFVRDKLTNSSRPETSAER